MLDRASSCFTDVLCIRGGRYGRRLARHGRSGRRSLNRAETMGVRHRPATRCSPEPETMAPVVMTNGEPDMRRTFHEQLEDLKADVIRLGGMTVELISGATLALLDSDLAVA